MNARLYDPSIGRFVSPDPYVQAPDFSQNFNRYSYCLNNPLKYTDPSGKIIGIDDLVFFAICAAIIGGVTNLAYKASNGQIDSFWNGLSAFGIGAAAGGIGAVAGAYMFTLAGGSLAVAGSGGFWSGLAGGVAGSAVSIPIESFGNHWVFGDDLMSASDYLTSVATAGLIGGVVNGCAALNQGRSFWNGETKAMPSWGVIQQTDIHENVLNTNNTSDVKTKPLQNHHFATDKNKIYTPQMKRITDKYELDLNGKWNKELLPHQGRHPNRYHEWVLKNMRAIDRIPNMNQQQFIYYFDLRIKQPIINNPDMLYKEYWLYR